MDINTAINGTEMGSVGSSRYVKRERERKRDVERESREGRRQERWQFRK
jgi:hypothetical protein